MTTFDGTIDSRKLIARFSRAPAGGTQEDYADITMHLLKIVGGSPTGAWVTADYTGVESAFDTLWGSLKVYAMPWCSLAEYRWYKDGDAWSPVDRGNGPPNPATRITARAVVGTAAASTSMPPQVAVSVTKVTDERKRWGRFFLPLTTTALSATDATGRIGTVTPTLIGFLTTFFNACTANGTRPVVWSRARSSHAGKAGTIGTHAATYYSVNSLQIDNLFDVIRSRRWDAPTVRSVSAALT